MELREFAINILSATTLEDKLFEPQTLTDLQPGPAIFWKEPSRPAGMHFQKHTRKDKLPAFHEHHKADNRAVCLHRFAGHELLAVEIMAYAILAFPEAPKHFRKGLANTLIEEQGHVRLYMKRMEELGIKFGDMPLYKYFWSFVPYITDPAKYVSLMSLTFEMANLDFAPHYGQSFLRNGDTESAALMAKILEDEIAHVSFGMNWLKKLKDPSLSEWNSWLENIPSLITPKRARGFIFSEDNRRKAGVPEDWIQNLKGSPQKR